MEKTEDDRPSPPKFPSFPRLENELTSFFMAGGRNGHPYHPICKTAKTQGDGPSPLNSIVFANETTTL